MQSYDDLVQLARICARQAENAPEAAVREELLRLAAEYRQRAAGLRHGVLSSPTEETRVRAELASSAPRQPEPQAQQQPQQQLRGDDDKDDDKSEP